jgi:hypothetical protein
VTTEGPDNVILEHLRAICAKTARIHEELHDANLRLANLEIVHGAVANTYDLMPQSIDRLTARLDRIHESFAASRDRSLWQLSS